MDLLGVMTLAARKSAHLAAVPSDTNEAPVSTSSVRSAAASGSQRELLVALRERIASDIDAGVPARDLASLSKRLVDITHDIAKIDADDKGDDVGEAADTPDEAWPAT